MAARLLAGTNRRMLGLLAGSFKGQFFVIKGLNVRISGAIILSIHGISLATHAYRVLIMKRESWFASRIEIDGRAAACAQKSRYMSTALHWQPDIQQTANAIGSRLFF